MLWECMGRSSFYSLGNMRGKFVKKGHIVSSVTDERGMASKHLFFWFWLYGAGIALSPKLTSVSVLPCLLCEFHGFFVKSEIYSREHPL